MSSIEPFSWAQSDPWTSSSPCSGSSSGPSPGPSSGCSPGCRLTCLKPVRTTALSEWTSHWFCRVVGLLVGNNCKLWTSYRCCGCWTDIREIIFSSKCSVIKWVAFKRLWSFKRPFWSNSRLNSRLFSKKSYSLNIAAAAQLPIAIWRQNGSVQLQNHWVTTDFLSVPF